MDINLLSDLSNADSIASNEKEVRNIIKNALKMYANDFSYDGLGSLMVTKRSSVEDAPTVMFASHLDEVGFMIRNISDIGFAYLMAVGGVEDRAKINQPVRVTTQSGKKITGLMNVIKNTDGQIEDMYVDFGFDSREAVLKAGINIGDMVVFDSQFKRLAESDTVMGKAMDDRAGDFALINAMQKIAKLDLKVNVVAAFTSSEEVGCRGAKLCSYLKKPDLFFAVDVAKHPELDRGFTNHRKLGYGPMLEFYDKTMIPNRKLINYLNELATKNKIPYQHDMFKGGGTDAATAHLENGGTVSAVLGFPIKYCHDPHSFANLKDFSNMSKLIVTIAQSLSEQQIKDFYTY
ncbi:aminopeptidase [Lactobacillus crispatus]|uniref:Aminopeptidase n=1 Tax=Lactobacillus crispatus (strain ST1) TaxID=748671 RepID=D5GYL8_LACCS|nr:aminopeptidase [Lactobacillus crispatus]CBL50877.1 Aminopeptidase [Lactobacillus crispatus ST1]